MELGGLRVVDDEDIPAGWVKIPIGSPKGCQTKDEPIGVRSPIDELRSELGALRRDVADQMTRVLELLEKQQRRHHCGNCGRLGHHAQACKYPKPAGNEEDVPRPAGMGPQPAARRVRGRGKRVR